MKYYIIKNRIKAFENELDTNLYDYQQLTDSQATFYEANPTASISEILAEQLNTPSAEQLLQSAKQAKLSEFKKWLKEQKNRTYYFNLSTTKAINTKLSADVISLKESLDDVAIDNDYDNATRNSMTTDLWYNADQTQVDITYLELIEIRIEIAKIKTDLLRREKIISAYINAQTSVQAVEGITKFGTIDISAILQTMQGGA